MFGLGLGQIGLIWMAPLVYAGADPETISAVESFNAFFSLTFEFGILAFIWTVIVTLLARS
jgi:hypothetical protein